jgi:peptidoglycan/LPS O-acetylase OafA/YrhL
MIGLLLALHPRSWRVDYGDEFRDVLADTPLTVAVIVDVLRNAGRQHIRAHPLSTRLAAALALSVVVEMVAVHTHVTANILWPPTTPLRSLVLGALLACWVPVMRRVGEAARNRRRAT